MFLGFGANDVDILESSLPIDPKISQILSEKTRAFAEKKNRDEGENENRDKSVPAEVELDRFFSGKFSDPRWRPNRSNGRHFCDSIHRKNDAGRGHARAIYLVLRFCDGVAVGRTNWENCADGSALPELALGFDPASM